MEAQCSLHVHVRASPDKGIDLAVANLDGALENTADDAFLAPDLTGRQFPIGV